MLEMFLASWRIPVLSYNRPYLVIENFLFYARIEVIASDEKAVKLLRQDRVTEAGTLIGLLAKKKAREYNRGQDLQLDVRDEDAGISQEYLTRVIDELVDNAFKFSEAGTPVVVSVHSSSDGLSVTIRDSGRGMTLKEVARIGASMQFNRRMFEQQGTGLGLTIAQRLVKIHGGTMRIESKQGIGTTVTLNLPSTPVEN